MPRLLRVFSEPAYPVIKNGVEEKHEGVARNYLADDFNLPKKSKVGLTSIVIGIQPNTFEVTSANQNLAFRTSRNHIRQDVVLPIGEYTTDLSDVGDAGTITNLQHMVEYQMNMNLQAEDWGFMWGVGMNAENPERLEIAYALGETSELMILDPEPNCRQSKCGFTGAPNYEWNNLTGSGADYDAFVVSKMPVCLGAGELVIILTKIASDNDFIGGLIDPANSYPAAGGELPQEAYRYGFRVDVAGNIFAFTCTDPWEFAFIDEEDTGTNLDLAAVERLALRLDDGELKIVLEGNVIYNFHTSGIANGVFVYGVLGVQDSEEGYLGALSFLSNNNPILTNFRVCENPFLADNPPADPAPVVSLLFNVFGGLGAGKLLGFDTFEEYTLSGYTNTFIGSRALDSVNIGQEEGYPFLIEILAPFNIQSFNGSTHHRENIIKYLVDYSNISNAIYYNSEVPLMLELNNANEIPLKEIGIRIRDLDGTIIKDWYLLQAVLIFDS